MRYNLYTIEYRDPKYEVQGKLYSLTKVTWGNHDPSSDMEHFHHPINSFVPF